MTIEVSGLTKRFGAVEAVTDLTFTVEPGVVTGFLGPNGAGKTTTMRMILGLVTPTAGTATIGGLRYAELARPMATVGAMVDAAAHPGRSGLDHLRVVVDMAGLPARRVGEVITELDMAGFADRRVGGWSTGMRQRLGLATALLGDPPVLLLDEPSNGLDPAGVSWLRRFLGGLAGEGRTVLVSSHVLAEMEQLAEHLVVIADGRLLAAGTRAELTSGGASLEDAFLRLTEAGAR